MRILIAGQTYFPAFNGQAIFTVNLAEGLARLGHKVLMVAPSTDGRAGRMNRRGVDIRLTRSICLSAFNASAHYTVAPGAEVKAIFAEFQPDIVHIHDHYPISQGAMRQARRHGVKVIGTNHFMPENIAPYFPLSRRYNMLFELTMWQWVFALYNRLDVATAPSRTAAGIMLQAGIKVPVFPISCGVDPQRFYPDPQIDRAGWRARFGLLPDRFVFIYVGRVDGEKRLDTLLQALAKLKRSDVQLAIVGRGAASGDLQSLAKNLRLGDRVVFTGFVDDEHLSSLLNSADVFIMPSDAELLSIASLEAMSCRLPVLLADARALPELVSEGVNGYLFKPGDPVDVARAMTLMLDLRERWPQMGAASLDAARRHHLDNTLRIYERLYEAVIHGGSFPIRPVTVNVQPFGKRLSKAIAQLWE